MPAERVGAVTIRAGDRVRYCGNWFDVEGVRRVFDPLGALVLFDCIDEADQERCLFARPDAMVRAEQMPRGSTVMEPA